MIAVVHTKDGQRGKRYRLANDDDLKVFIAAEEALSEKQRRLAQDWGISPVPDEPIPLTELRRITVPLFGMESWHDLFNGRQRLALIVLIEKVREAYLGAHFIL